MIFCGEGKRRAREQFTVQVDHLGRPVIPPGARVERDAGHHTLFSVHADHPPSSPCASTILADAYNAGDVESRPCRVSTPQKMDQLCGKVSSETLDTTRYFNPARLSRELTESQAPIPCHSSLLSSTDISASLQQGASASRSDYCGCTPASESEIAESKYSAHEIGVSTNDGRIERGGSDCGEPAVLIWFYSNNS